MLDFRYRKKRDVVDARLQKGFDAVFVEKDDEVLKETRKQINEYLIGERKEFDIPIVTVGTNFQKQVGEAFGNIKYGKTVSYLELAKNIDNEKAVRAVASANGANALGLIITCHRVIESGGGLGGYGGGVSTKKKLLKLEKVNSNQILF